MHLRFSASAVFFSSVAAIIGAAGCATYDDPGPPVYSPGETVYYPGPDGEIGTADDVVAIDDVSEFDQPLAPYGDWITVGSYGRCWHPRQVDADWQPYSNGHWVNTDDGWYWESDEPWGWATYHYGRWDYEGNIGWIWVPGTRWAPAWVEWRNGGGYVGWAPLPPSTGIGVRVDVREVRDPNRAYVFVPERRFTEPIRRSSVVVHNENIVRETRNITNINVEHNVVINRGPSVQTIERATGHPVQEQHAVQLRRARERTVVASHPELQRRHDAHPSSPAAATHQNQTRYTSTPHSQTAPRPALERRSPEISSPAPANAQARTPDVRERPRTANPPANAGRANPKADRERPRLGSPTTESHHPVLGPETRSENSTPRATHTQSAPAEHTPPPAARAAHPATPAHPRPAVAPAPQAVPHTPPRSEHEKREESRREDTSDGGK